MAGRAEVKNMKAVGAKILTQKLQTVKITTMQFIYLFILWNQTAFDYKLAVENLKPEEIPALQSCL